MSQGNGQQIQIRRPHALRGVSIGPRLSINDNGSKRDHTRKTGLHDLFGTEHLEVEIEVTGRGKWKRGRNVTKHGKEEYEAPRRAFTINEV